MDLNSLDLRLKLNIDNYLKQYESFKFVELLLNKYNELDKVKENSCKDLIDTKFYDNFRKVYNFLSVLSLSRDFDDKELLFISELAYKQKGSIESIKTILSLVKCTYENLNIDDNLKLSMNIVFEDVREIYLVSKYLQLLCQDLLFYDSYNVIIDSMSIRYKLTGDVSKRYAIYTTYDLESKSYNVQTNTTSDTISDIKIDDTTSLDDLQDSTITSYSDTGLKTITEKRVKVDTSTNTYTVTETITQESYEELDTYTIDTYEW